MGKYPLWYDEASPVLEEASIFHLPSVSKFLNPGFSLEKQDYLFLYNHSILYYWKKIAGNSEFNLRLSSVFFGMLGLFMAYKLGRLVYSRNVALLSVFLLAISPFHIKYSQELRPYAIWGFFSLLSFYALFKIVKENRKLHWAIYVLANTVSIYCHSMMCVVLPAEAIALLINCRRKRQGLKLPIVAHILIIIFIAPVLIIALPNVMYVFFSPIGDINLTRFAVWGGPASFLNILFTLKNFSIGFYIDFYSLAGMVMTATYFIFYIFGNYKDNDRARVLFNVILLVLPVFSIFILSKFSGCYIDRYFFPLLPLYTLGVGNGVYSCRKWVIFPVLIIVTILTSLGLKNYYNDKLPDDYRQHRAIPVRKDNIDHLAGFLAGNFKAGDSVFVLTKLEIFPLKFYVKKFLFKCKDEDKAALLSEIDALRWFWTDSNDKLIFVSYNRNRPTLNRNSKFSLSDAGYRIWVINSPANSLPEKTNAILGKIKDAFIEKEKYNFKNLELYLFVRR